MRRLDVVEGMALLVAMLNTAMGKFGHEHRQVTGANHAIAIVEHAGSNFVQTLHDAFPFCLGYDKGHRDSPSGLVCWLYLDVTLQPAQSCKAS